MDRKSEPLFPHMILHAVLMPETVEESPSTSWDMPCQSSEQKMHTTDGARKAANHSGGGEEKVVRTTTARSHQRRKDSVFQLQCADESLRYEAACCHLQP